MKTKNISESLGYIKAVNDIIGIIKEMSPDNSKIEPLQLVAKILIGKPDLSIAESGETYTMDMIDPNNHTKVIAGEDALFLNPVYNLNKK